jgi:cell division protein FtsL
MNAAAKVMSQSNFFSGQLSDCRLSKQLWMQVALVCSVLISALAVVYVTNSHRLAFSQLQASVQQAHQLELQWGQLLLEQASLATPARVQELASEKLEMMLPTAKQTIILRLK